VPHFYTSKGENWSVEVRAFDGLDQGPAAYAWVLVRNAPPVVKQDLPDPALDEDTVDSDWLDLSTAFEDPDGDPVEWSLATEPVNITVDIDPVTGVVTLTPRENWSGEENVTFVASDGEGTASQTVTVYVLPVNDVPWIATVDGEPVTGETLEYTIKQGQELLITYTLADVEGDQLVASVTSSAVTHDEAAGTIRFAPQNDEVGTISFSLRVNDVVDPDAKVTLDFVITVENENDPMEVPVITSPANGTTFKVNQSFTMIATCDDPDIQFGQVLNFTWESNISGLLGHGTSLEAVIAEPGTHLITLTVRDPDFSKTATITIVVEAEGGWEPPPPPDDDDEEPASYNWLLIVGVVAALVVVGAVLFLVGTRRRAERIEVEEEAAFDAEVKREALERTRDALSDLADEWEAGREAGDAEAGAKAEAAGWEAETPGIEGAPGGQLSIEAAVSGEASEEVEGLFAGGEAAEPVMSEDEMEAMRLENLKRKYQNAIGRLPYGIPSKELADRDWVELAAVLASGDKRTVEGGREVTEIGGRWYYSDHEDTGTFLKEHGRKEERKEEPRRAAAPRAATSMTDEEMLRKLEERFVLGEISEEAYYELKEKYGG
jgi:hypothetical protein